MTAKFGYPVGQSLASSSSQSQQPGLPVGGGDLPFHPYGLTDAQVNAGAAGNVGALPLTPNLQALASANVTSLQAFLAGGGGPVAGPGNLFINSPILLGDGARLSTTPGTLLKVTDGAQVAAIETTPNAIAYTNIAVTWTAGSTASVAWAGHGCAAEDVIVMQGVLGTTLAGWFDVCRIISITDTDNFVIQLPFTPTAAPIGQMTAKKCVRNLVIDLDLDQNFTNNSGTGQNLGRMCSVFSFIADSEITIRGRDAYKYVVLLAGALNVTVKAFGFPNTHSDTLKIYGPAREITATVLGEAAEDCVTIQALEPAAFRAYMPCWGNIRSITVSGSANQTSAGSAPCVVYSDDTFTTDGILFERLSCSTMAAANPAIAVKPGTGYLATASLIGDITVRLGRLSTISEACILITTKVRTLRIESVKFKAPDADNLRVLKVTDNVANLFIDKLAFDGSTWPVAGTGYLMEILGTVPHMVVKDSVFRGTTNLRVLDWGANSVGAICTFDNCEGDTIDVLCRVESTATTPPIVTIRGGRYSTVLTGANMRKSGTVILKDAYFFNMSNGACRGEIAGTNVKLYEGGCTFAGTSVPLALLTTATADLYAPTLSIDVGITGINKTAGTVCINSGAGRGTLVAGHTVIGNGTAFVQVDTPANTF